MQQRQSLGIVRAARGEADLFRKDREASPRRCGQVESQRRGQSSKRREGHVSGALSQEGVWQEGQGSWSQEAGAKEEGAQKDGA